MIFEYTASGTKFTRITFDNCCKTPEINLEINRLISLLQSDKHKFSMLYNAYTEESIGKILYTFYKNSLYSIHSDSGGLQVITRGSNITSDIKKQIYQCQGKYSNIAMSFDEIPLKTTGNSVIGSTSDRFFDAENLKEYAKLSGQNYLEQLQYFLDNNYDTKPMAIIHGNCYDTFMQFYDVFMKEIPDQYIQYIGGISLSGAAHGSGITEDTERAYVMTKLPFKKYHLLGVGSISRLLPYLAFNVNGLLDDIHLSYDSTSHTRILSFGSYYLNYETIKFGRHYNLEYEKLYTLLNNFVGEVNLTPEEFHEIMNLPPSEYILKNPNKMLEYYKMAFGTFVFSVKNFMNNVDDVSDEKKLLKLADRFGLTKEIKYISMINDTKDLESFVRDNQKKSSRIKAVNNGFNLESFF